MADASTTDPRNILGTWRLSEAEMESAWSAAKLAWKISATPPGTESYYVLVRILEDMLAEKWAKKGATAKRAALDAKAPV
jgi:hypothetical protein